MVVAGGQDVDLHHVVFQFILCLCVDNLGSSEGPVLLVLSLKASLTQTKKIGKKNHGGYFSSVRWENKEQAAKKRPFFMLEIFRIYSLLLDNGSIRWIYSAGVKLQVGFRGETSIHLNRFI